MCFDVRPCRLIGVVVELCMHFLSLPRSRILPPAVCSSDADGAHTISLTYYKLVVVRSPTTYTYSQQTKQQNTHVRHHNAMLFV